MPYRPSRDCTPGYVYLMRSADIHKIGFSKNPDNRLRAAHAEGWNCDLSDLRLIHKIATNNMAMAEAELHRRFSDRRMPSRRKHGSCEWFRLSDADVNWILSLSEYNVL